MDQPGWQLSGRHHRDKIGVVCQAIILVTTIVLLAVLGANVVARYTLGGGGLHWVSEVPEQLFPWLIAAGIVLAVQHGAHIAVDISSARWAAPADGC
jgi:TRAP-type C4-dicarboxylate transport system permease small subunit